MSFNLWLAIVECMVVRRFIGVHDDCKTRQVAQTFEADVITRRERNKVLRS